VKHARKHLASDDPDHLPTIQKGMALLAFSGDTSIQPYRELLSDDRWVHTTVARWYSFKPNTYSNFGKFWRALE
jgi:hypothetical protein